MLELSVIQEESYKTEKLEAYFRRVMVDDNKTREDRSVACEMLMLVISHHEILFGLHQDVKNEPENAELMKRAENLFSEVKHQVDDIYRILKEVDVIL